MQNRSHEDWGGYSASCRIVNSGGNPEDTTFKPQILFPCLCTWESILICMTVLASVFTNTINLIHFTSDKPLLHCFSSGALNVLERDTSNLELPLERSRRLSCACFSIKKACHVLTELGGMLEVNCLLSNLKQESLFSTPRSEAEGQVLTQFEEKQSCQDLRTARE